MVHSKQQQQHRNILFKQSLIEDSLHVWSIIGLPLRRTQAKYVILNAYFKTSIIRGGYTGVYVPGGAHCGNPGGPRGPPWIRNQPGPAGTPWEWDPNHKTMFVLVCPLGVFLRIVLMHLLWACDNKCKFKAIWIHFNMLYLQIFKQSLRAKKLPTTPFIWQTVYVIPNISFFIWPEGVNEVGINLASGNIVLVRSSSWYL